MRNRITLSGTSADLHSRRSREDLINCYLETDSKGAFVRITRAPAFRTLSEVGSGPIRGMYEAGGVVYVVSGTEFYRCTVSPFGALSAVLKGTVTGQNGNISMDSIGTDLPQVLILTNHVGYIYDESADTFTEITSVNFDPDYAVTSFNSRFWLNKPDSNEFFGSDILDGQTYNALFFASADNNPDSLRILKSLNTELLMFGATSIERWQDIGVATGFPLRRVQGGTINRGIAAAKSLAQWESTLFWLADDFTVRMLSGGEMRKVSDLALEQFISQYNSPTAAIGFFVDFPYYKAYCLTFPQNDVTWCYDVMRGIWHKRKSTDVDCWRVSCSVQASNITLLGDRFNGNIYAMDNTVYTEGGVTTPMVFITAPTTNNDAPVTYSYLEIVADMGVGTIGNVDEIGQISNAPLDPMISCARSIDGGFTYRWLPDRSLGAVGSRMNKVIWRENIRVPRTNDLVHKFMASGNFPVNIYAAYTDGEAGRV
jgi:hypothetical protein